MSTTVQVTQSISPAGSPPVSGTRTETGDSLIRLDKSFPAASTDAAGPPCAFTTAGLQSIFLVADQDCTIETNSGSSPGNTIALKAGRPFAWNKSDGYFTNPFTTNVTSLFVTCTPATVLKGYVLHT
jgi:hypothetical protein